MSERSEDQSKDFRSTARSLGIPESSWEQPLIREYIDFVSRIENLQMDISIAESNTSRKGPDLLIQQRQLLNSPDLKWPLRTKYYAAELLLRAVRMILTMDVGKTYTSEPRRYIANKINVAINVFGYEVVEKKKPT